MADYQPVRYKRGLYMEYVGYFSELNLSRDTGSILSLIVFEVNYDKEKMIDYLRSRKYTARCMKKIIDCVTGDYISSNYVVYDDGEFCWCDFLIYHVHKYDIMLPDRLIDKAGARL